MKANKIDMSPKEFFSGDKQWGNMNVSWNEYSEVPDQKSLFKGLPDNLCQCPHWGYVVRGSIRIKYRDYDEVINEGELYYVPPGHKILRGAQNDRGEKWDWIADQVGNDVGNGRPRGIGGRAVNGYGFFAMLRMTGGKGCFGFRLTPEWYGGGGR